MLKPDSCYRAAEMDIQKEQPKVEMPEANFNPIDDTKTRSDQHKTFGDVWGGLWVLEAFLGMSFVLF